MRYGVKLYQEYAENPEEFDALPIPQQIKCFRYTELNNCANNFEYFIDKYGHIEDKDNPVDIIQPFTMWEAQRETARSIKTHRLNIALKARQLGISWLAAHDMAHELGCFDGHTAICLSKSEEEAKELVRRVGVVLRYANELFAEQGYEPKGWNGPVFKCTALTVEIYFPDSGKTSKLQGLASSPGAGRSFTANLVVFDEWAFQQFAREIWEGAYPTINRPTGGRVFGLSTIARGSLFEQLFTDPDNGFNKIFIPWNADPRRDEEWYEKTKRALGDGITAEYPSTIEEALMVPGGAFYPEVKRDTHETKEEFKGNIKRYCAIDYGLDALAAIWIMKDTEGNELAYRCLKEPNLTIKQACELLVSRSAYEHIDAYIAPDDLWNRRQETGKSVADIFYENGVNLFKVNRDMFNGCIQVKEHIAVNEHTGKPQLMFLYGTCDILIHDMQKIQKDKAKPTIYAKNPHELTHLNDALRYYCTFWTTKAGQEEKKRKQNRWTDDMIEDWDNANDEIRKLMRERYGEPIR